MLTESVLFAVQAFLFCCGLASPAGLPPPLRCPAAASSSPSLSDLMPVPSRLPEPYLFIDIGMALRSVTSPSAGAINTGLQHFQFIGHGEVKPTTMLTESVLFAVQAFLFCCGLASPAGLPPPLRCPAAASSSPSLSDLMPVPSRLPEPYLPIDIGVALRSVTSPSAGAINTGLQHFQFIGHGEVKPTTMLTESVLFAVQAFLFCCGLASPAGLPPPLRCPAAASSSPSLSDLMPVPSRLPEPYLPIDIGVALRSVTSPSAGAINTGLQHFQFIGHGEVKPTTMLTESVLFAVQAFLFCCGLASPVGLPPPLQCPAAASSSPSLSDLMPVPSRLPEPYLFIDIGMALRSVTSPSAGAINTGLQHFQFIGHGEVKPTTMLTESVLFAVQAFLFCCGLASPAGLPPPLRCPAAASSSPSLSDLMPVPSRLPEPYLFIDIGMALRSVTSPSAGAINTGLQHFQFIGHGEVKPTTMLTESVLFAVQAFLFCCGLASPAGLPPPLRCPAAASSSPSLSDLMPVPSRLPEPYLFIDIGMALRSVTSPSAGAINTGLQHFQFIGHGEVKPTTMLTESVLFAVQAFLFCCGLASPAGLPPPLRYPAAASSSPSLSDLMPVPSRLPEPYLPIDIGMALRSVTSPSAGAINTGLQHFQFIGHGEVKPTTMLTESVIFAVQAFLFCCGLASPAGLPPPLRCPAAASSSPSLSDLMPVPSRLPEPYLPIDIGVALRSVTSTSAGAINTGLQHFQFIGHGEVKPTTMLTESVLFAVRVFLFCCGLASPAGLPPPLRCPAAASSSPSLSDLMPVPSRLSEPYLPIDIGVALRSVTSTSAGAINTGLQHFQFIGHGEVKPTTMLTESVLFAVQSFRGNSLVQAAEIPEETETVASGIKRGAGWKPPDRTYPCEQPAARTSGATLQVGLLTQPLPNTSGAYFVSIFQGPAYHHVAIPPHSSLQVTSDNQRGQASAAARGTLVSAATTSWQPAARTSGAALQGGLLTQPLPTTRGACFVSIFQGPAYPCVAIPPHSSLQVTNDDQRGQASAAWCRQPPPAGLTEDVFLQMSRKIKQLENENRRLETQAALQKTREATFRSHLHKIFTADQLAALSRSSNRWSKWSDETVKKSLQMRFACGSTGYDLLLEGNFPLPSSKLWGGGLKASLLSGYSSASKLPIDYLQI
ncbi:hypothetical protein ISCGN_026168 [Ixodes scapularis]